MATFYDPEMEELQRQQAFADVLRKQALQGGGQMAGRIYVPKNPLASFAEGLAGGIASGQTGAARQALDEGRRIETERWMKQMPAAVTQQEVAGPMPDGSAMAPIEVPKDPRVQARELQEWAGQGMNIRSPLAQAVAQQGLSRAIAMPEKQAELAERTAARQAEQEARSQQARELQAERLAEQRRQAEEGRALRLTLAQMARGNSNQNADLQRQIMETNLALKQKQLKEGTAAEQKLKAAQRDRDATLDEAARNLDEMIGTPEKPGLISESTGSGAGALVDTAMGFFGRSLPGARAAAQLAPMADTILKMVPRFEGPQSDKDTQSYKEAAGQLANSALPRETRVAAAMKIRELLQKRRGQFGVKGYEDVPTGGGGGEVVDFGSLK